MTTPRILVVDNIADFRETVVRIVSGLGYEVDSARNLEEALAKVAERTYDLALVDLSLSELGTAQAEDDFKNIDGLVLVRRIRDSKEGTQVVVLSGQPDTQVVADCIQESGAQVFLAKKVLRSAEQGDGLDRLVGLVKKHVALARINVLDGHDNALWCLTMKRDTEIWIDRALRAFNPVYGQDGLKRYFTDFLNRLGPVRQLRDNPWAIDPDMRSGRASGMFWSKKHGAAMLAVFGASPELMEQEAAARAPKPLPEVLLELAEYNIHGRVLLLPDQPRSLFREP